MLQRLQNRLPQRIQNRINFWTTLASFLVGVLFLGAAIVHYGFILDEHDMRIIQRIYDFVWYFYFLLFTFRFIARIFFPSRDPLGMHLFLATLIYVSALVRFFPMPASWPMVAWLWKAFGNQYVVLSILALFALLGISRGIVSFINKKTNPALLLAASFAIIIFVGTLLLLVPRSTIDGYRLPVVDALFVSTSAVCVTGLTPVDVATTFTLEGQIVIALLIQIGGLGVMTITSFFALFFMGDTRLYNQFALRDMITSDTFQSLMATLFYIFGFTAVIELGGAYFIWLDIHGTLGMTLPQEVFFAVFHSVSAFCNAGFSTLTGNLGHPAVMHGHNGLYITISCLVVLGGIGFPVLVNMRNVLFQHIKRRWHHLLHRKQKEVRISHLMQINSKIVVVTSLLLLGVGTLALAALEWNNAFAQMPVADKLTHAFFNAVVPRTAGFNSVDLTHFSAMTLMVYMVLMWIGGGSQSTAGGIKVNTFAVACANFLSIVRGCERVVLFNREIPSDSVRRASATIFGSLMAVLLFFGILVLLEPTLSPASLLFETISAIGTVGSSLNVTPQLGDASKVLLSFVMFVGRVGLITILMSMVRHRGPRKFRYPTDHVIIN